MPARSPPSCPLRGVGRPLLEAAQRFPAVPRVLESSGGPAPGEEAWVGVGCEGGRGQSHCPLPASSSAAFSPGACGFGAPPGAQLPPQPRSAGERALLAPRRSRRSSWEGGSDRRLLRAASGGREPSWRSRHLEPWRRAGERVPGKGAGGWARGARRAGSGRAPVPGCAWGGEGVRGGVWPLGRRSGGLPFVSPQIPGES